MARNEKPEYAASQRAKIRRDLLNGKRITQLGAVRAYGCLRLSERIRELDPDGFFIIHEPTKRNGKRFMTYFVPAEFLKVFSSYIPERIVYK